MNVNDDKIWNGLVGEFNGKDRFEARKAVIKRLEEIGALVKIEDDPLQLVTRAYRGYGLLPLVHAMVRRWTNWLKEMPQATTHRR